MVPLHGGEHPEGPARDLQRGQLKQRPNLVRRRPDPGRQVHESAEMAANAEELRFLLQVAAPSQKLCSQFCIYVSELLIFCLTKVIIT